VGFGHVGRVGRMRAADGAPAMGGDALAAVEDLDGGGGQECVDVFVQQRVRDGVVMPIEFDVVVGKASAGSGRSAGWSSRSKSSRRLAR
jgi:hypothetical protein